MKQCQSLLTEIEEAAAKNDLPQAELYFKTKQELLTKEINFHRGDWVNLNFTPDMRHWRRFGGRYQVESPTSMLGASSDREKQFLYYNTSFPVPYEVELKVEGVRWHYWGKSLPAGAMFGQMFDRQTGLLFWVDTFNKRIGFARPGSGLSSYPLEVEKAASLKITIHDDGHFEMFDGVKNARNYRRKDFQPGLIGLGILPWFNYSGEVRYSDMRIRKVAPSNREPEAQVVYYLQRLEEKESYDSYLSLGLAYENLENYEQAIEAFAAAEKLLPTAALPAQRAAFSLSQLKRHEEARQTMERGLKKCVGDQAVHRSQMLQFLVLFYASREAEFRDADKALAYAEELLAPANNKEGLTGDILVTVSAAYAEAGQFERAIKSMEAAIELAKKNKKRKKELKRLQKMLKLYQDGKPYRDE